MSTQQVGRSRQRGHGHVGEEGGRKDDVSGGGGGEGGRLEVESYVPSVGLAVWRRVGAPALK